MSKQTIKFQPVHPEPPSKVMAKKHAKRQKPTDGLPFKIFLDNLPVGFIRVDPKITIFIKGEQLPGKFQSMQAAKAYAINHLNAKRK